ncbi:glycosyltransferase family 8 protein [Cylindrobasidium torrendii FP15055 ss-10]|uniref:Glycosyltransferase family 8 protein n=1 Tax=Cylindrobasidium torrendii FP15055 ss-10 TaxID=1314674 RepID=A0A0D7BGH1_9AGAR|nr:glycosyltransferase family 8 protein [Cylindrobasidium torrendii FP15055 ss-10]
MSEDNEYHFTDTQDWFSGHIESWRALFPMLAGIDHPRILEIGTWEGRSAVFLLNELDGEIVTIDHFDSMESPQGRARSAKVHHNLALTGKPYCIIQEFSVPGLMSVLVDEMSKEDPGFDWVYIDGSHRADDTVLDGELAWRLAREGAIVVFDDYRWDKEEPGGIEHPKRGINAFLALHQGEYDVLSKPGDYQYIIRKTVKMRIGFLVTGHSTELAKQDAFGYGVNLAFAADASYAMPLAVALRSALKNISGRCTAYIYDCGISDSARESLRTLTRDASASATIVFMEPTEASLSSKGGPAWAKVDMIKALPVERALYLDADTLVRGDINTLWNTDMGGKPVGAVRDTAFQNGHSELAGVTKYFNAGVLLLDLAKARARLDSLFSSASKMIGVSRFEDQDCLNQHFSGDWYSLDARYNAQGLGTYNKEGQADPCIVHFTGPLHPNVGIVLNPWVQPYTAKPWGYAGAPGHPFAMEWKDGLEETPWKGVMRTKGFQDDLEEEKRRALTEAGSQVDAIFARVAQAV